MVLRGTSGNCDFGNFPCIIAKATGYNNDDIFTNRSSATARKPGPSKTSATIVAKNK